MTILKLTADDADAKSADILADNIAQLNALFPEAFTEGKVDFEVLKQLLGGAIEEREEKYGLNWHGKRKARQLALTPSTGTLLPCPEDSVDWDTTKNLMIEGDNLEVLKLLQKSYAGKVKLIYIDPPYNTGKDFVYRDDFRDNIKNYLELTGQVEGGKSISSNTEASGRFHTDWLNMMYPRLKLARDLLRDDGIIFISIDEIEIGKLRAICDSIFGEDNHIADFVWKNKKGGGNDSKFIAVEHEYIVMYAKKETDLHEMFEPYKPEYLNRYKEIDDKGKFFWDTFKRKSGKQYYPIKCPDATVMEYDDDGNKISWLRSEARFLDDLKIGDVRFVKNLSGWSIHFKQRLPDGKKPRSIFLEDSIWEDMGTTSNGSSDTLELFGKNVFSNPKPKSLIEHIMAFGVSGTDLVVDFFAGSGTTGHAVMARNAADDCNCRYVLVQLPEPLDAENKDQKTAADYCDTLKKPRNIAELTKERLRRAAKKVQADHPDYKGDLGFRVFKLAPSNIRAWNPDRADLEKTLLDHTDHLKPGRSEQDVLYELLLKRGLDLCVPIETKVIAGKTVRAIGGGVMFACLADGINRDLVDPLATGIVAWRDSLKPDGDVRVFFKDSGFADDVAKTNMAELLKQRGITAVRSL
jgi:adenine-specific DNA-methyltransferase